MLDIPRGLSFKCVKKLNPSVSVSALVTLIDFTLSNARQFYSFMGNPSDTEGLSQKLRSRVWTGCKKNAFPVPWFRVCFFSVSSPQFRAVFPRCVLQFSLLIYIKKSNTVRDLSRIIWIEFTWLTLNERSTFLCWRPWSGNCFKVVQNFYPLKYTISKFEIPKVCV